MKSKKTFKQMVRQGCSCAAILCVCMTASTSCSRYDLDQFLPDGWGSSIYTKLEDEGIYTNTLRLIQDLGQQEVLSKTGSKTLFVADDDAYQRFYASNKWGVRCYEDLSTSQKKLLLNGAMINNSYQIATLSSVGSNGDVVEGQNVRRATASTIYDSVAVVPVSQLPCSTVEERNNNSLWAKFDGRSNVTLMEDMTAQPMVHYVEDYLVNNNFLNSDIDFLFNNKISRQAGDAIINGVPVIEQNIKCSNGFINKMSEVMLPLDNMASLINHNPNTTEFGRMMDRFSAPFYVGNTVTEQYNRITGSNVDSVFQKRYFSSENGRSLNTDDNGKVHQDQLNYDPGWNCYYVDKRSGESDEQALGRDMAFILAPSNKALNEYFTTGAGKILMEQYDYDVDKIPNSVIKQLVNNNLQSSFRLKGVESKFESILNDANDPMNVDPAMVDTVMQGCNGVVYVMNKVYTPTSFISVNYPTVVKKNLKLLEWAIEKNKYTVYLNSLNAYYSFFIPSNNSMLRYINPASYGMKDASGSRKMYEVYKFHYDETLSNPVWASVYGYYPDTDEMGDSITEERDPSLMADILKDVLDNCIVVNKRVDDGNEYYLTKAGTALRIKNGSDASAKGGTMTVEGSYQINDSKKPLLVTGFYDQSPESSNKGNGKCYILDSKPIMTTSKSVLEVMAEHSEMDKFRDLLEKSGLTEEIRNSQSSPNKSNISTFNSYNYTIYVPDNDAVDAVVGPGKKLRTWEEIDTEREVGTDEAKAQATRDSTDLIYFIKYHIQDNSLFIGAAPQSKEKYETASINSTTGKFERIYATLTNDDIILQNIKYDSNGYEVTDTNPVHVKEGGLYNLQAREYFLNSNQPTKATKVATSSSAVIHLVKKNLLYK